MANTIFTGPSFKYLPLLSTEGNNPKFGNDSKALPVKSYQPIINISTPEGQGIFVSLSVCSTNRLAQSNILINRTKIKFKFQ